LKPHKKTISLLQKLILTPRGIDKIFVVNQVFIKSMPDFSLTVPIAIDGRQQGLFSFNRFLYTTATGSYGRHMNN